MARGWGLGENYDELVIDDNGGGFNILPVLGGVLGGVGGFLGDTILGGQSGGVRELEQLETPDNSANRTLIFGSIIALMLFAAIITIYIYQKK